MPRFCIFGDTVNTASQMESTGLPSRIQMTDSSAAHLAQIGGFKVSERGTVDVKGKGAMRTFWLDGVSDQPVREENSKTSADMTLIMVNELSI